MFGHTCHMYMPYYAYPHIIYNIELLVNIPLCNDLFPTIVTVRVSLTGYSYKSGITMVFFTNSFFLHPSLG